MIPSLHQTLASAKKKVETSQPVFKKMSKKNLDRDKKFEEIKNTVAKKTKAKEAEPEEEVVREAYVGKQRKIIVFGFWGKSCVNVNCVKKNLDNKLQKKT